MFNHFRYNIAVLLCILHSYSVLSLNLPAAQLIDHPSPSNLTISLNEPLATNFSANRLPSIHCPGGPDYGNSLRRESCEDAANSMLTNLYFGSKRILEFKERNVRGGLTFTDVVLPYLSLSCEYLVSDDSCRITDRLTNSRWLLCH